MGQFWQMNGQDLNETTVKVSVLSDGLKSRQGVRQSPLTRLGLTDDTQRVGIGLPTLSISFTFRGAASAPKATTFREVWEEVRDAQAFTLQAPDGVKVYRTFSRVALLARRLPKLDGDGRGRVRLDLRLEAIVLGAWIADGGTYCHRHQLGMDGATGFFELESDGTFTFNGATNTGTVPAIELPDQTGGYPLGTNASFQEALIPTTGSRTITGADGTTVTVRTYDLTGFLIPTPASAGDRGIFHVCSSPTSAFLDHEDGTYIIASTGSITIITSGGMASVAMASAPMGT